jgi:hypothetical protein
MASTWVELLVILLEEFAFDRLISGLMASWQKLSDGQYSAAHSLNH